MKQKQKDHQVIFSVTRIVLMAAFLSAIFFANANPCFAAAVVKKSSAVAKVTVVELTEAQIKLLQNTLSITEAQEELWSNLTQAMRENAIDMDILTRDRVENAKPMNAVEHMKFHGRITEAHLDQFKKFVVPFEALYDSMSDEQKDSTDKLFQTGIFKTIKKRK